MLRPALVFSLTVFTMLSPPFAAAEGQGADDSREIKVTGCSWSSEIEDFKLEKAVKASEWIRSYSPYSLFWAQADYDLVTRYNEHKDVIRLNTKK